MNPDRLNVSDQTFNLNNAMGWSGGEGGGEGVNTKMVKDALSGSFLLAQFSHMLLLKEDTQLRKVFEKDFEK